MKNSKKIKQLNSQTARLILVSLLVIAIVYILIMLGIKSTFHSPLEQNSSSTTKVVKPQKEEQKADFVFRDIVNSSPTYKYDIKLFTKDPSKLKFSLSSDSKTARIVGDSYEVNITPVLDISFKESSNLKVAPVETKINLNRSVEEYDTWDLVKGDYPSYAELLGYIFRYTVPMDKKEMSDLNQYFSATRSYKYGYRYFDLYSLYPSYCTFDQLRDGKVTKMDMCDSQSVKIKGDNSTSQIYMTCFVDSSDDLKKCDDLIKDLQIIIQLNNS